MPTSIHSTPDSLESMFNLALFHRSEAINEAQIEVKRLTIEISKFQKDRQGNEAVIKSLEKQYAWIADQKQ